MRSPLLAAVLSTVGLAAAAACGGRTGLLAPGESGPGVGGVDAGDDATEPTDGPVTDGLPPLDVVQPVDAYNDCPDAGSTYIYLLTAQHTLLSFYPPTGTIRTVGTLHCPSPIATDPFSMAVDRTGVAYVLYENSTLTQGQVFRVSTLTAACAPTGFVSGLGGFPAAFGMGFSRDLSGPGETLYLAGDPGVGIGSILGVLDTTTFRVSRVGGFSPPISQPELTGTGGGQLFGFYATNGSAGSAIAQIDKTTAQVVGVASLPGVTQGGAWAFAFWGGDFYTFTAPGGPATSSQVTRYRPSDGSITPVGATPGLTIVGAGVSTCAPQR